MDLEQCPLEQRQGLGLFSRLLLGLLFGMICLFFGYSIEYGVIGERSRILNLIPHDSVPLF